MGRSRYRDTLTNWRTWSSVGAVIFLCWFLLLLARPFLVGKLQSFLLANRELLSLLPHGIATPRTTVEALGALGIPVVFVSLLLTLLFVSPREADEWDHGP